MIAKTLFISIGIAWIVFGLAVFTPYYHSRSEQHRNHLQVLRTICNGKNIPDKFQVNEVTYEGTLSNCTRATVFIATPVFLGAINDFWQDSIFYTLLHATDWKVQAVYAFCAVLVAYFGTKFIFSSWVINKASNGSLRIPGQTNDRQMMIVEKQQPMIFTKEEKQANEPPLFSIPPGVSFNN